MLGGVHGPLTGWLAQGVAPRESVSQTITFASAPLTPGVREISATEAAAASAGVGVWSMAYDSAPARAPFWIASWTAKARARSAPPRRIPTNMGRISATSTIDWPRSSRRARRKRLIRAFTGCQSVVTRWPRQSLGAPPLVPNGDRARYLSRID